MRFDRADYGANINAGRNRNNAASRGWGPGWPSNNSHKMGLAEAAGIKLWVRKELVPLIETLLACTLERGYEVKDVRDDWGYANRAIRGSNTPSNHSWGIAVDLNSTENPMASTFVSDIPPAVVKDWERCGFYWGGRYENRPDTMHFEYLGRPRDVSADLATAKETLRGLREPKLAPAEPARPFRGEHKQGTRVIKSGAQGADVAFLQRWLGLPDDGKFDARLVAKVKAYQKMHGLKADGIVGEKTWTVILGRKVSL